MKKTIQFDKLPLKTKDLTSENIAKISSLFPNLITETEKDGKVIKTINASKLKEVVGDFASSDSEVYELTWVGKQESKQKIVAPITKTLRPVPEDSVDFENTENLYIEGDNFEVLKVLQESYLNKVKMIYIDPPYNTGNDFIYKDKFSMTEEEYEEESGAVDEEGNKLFLNTTTNGRFHSDWLSMMYERLVIAKDLLRDDGIIMVSIDDGEMGNLRLMMNEIFGEHNTLDRGTLIWENKGSTKGFNKIVKNHEYILSYAKNGELVKSVYGGNFLGELGEIEHYCYNAPNPGNPPCKITFKAGCKIRGVENQVFHGKVGDEVSLKIISGDMIFKEGILKKDVVLEGAFPYRFQIEDFFKNQPLGKPTFDYKGQKWEEIYFNSKGLPRYRKSRNTVIISSIVNDPEIPNYGSEDIKEIFGKKEIFPFPKPKELMIHLCKFFLAEGDTVIDFFSGSATTAHAVMKLNAETNMNRNFIMIQLPEKTAEDSEAFKAGYKNICEIGKERIRRAAKKIQEELKEKNKQSKLAEEKIDLSKLDFGFRVFRLDSSNMKDVYYNPNELDQRTLTNFKDNIKEDRTDKDLLYQVLLDLAVPISAKVEEQEIKKKTIYKVNENFLIACFDDNIDLDIVKEIAKLNPLRLVFKDSSFKDDSAKVNVAEYLKHKLSGCIVKVI